MAHARDGTIGNLLNEPSRDVEHPGDRARRPHRRGPVPSSAGILQFSGHPVMNAWHAWTRKSASCKFRSQTTSYRCDGRPRARKFGHPQTASVLLTVLCIESSRLDASVVPLIARKVCKMSVQNSRRLNNIRAAISGAQRYQEAPYRGRTV
jgi:hypothetical protein